MSLESKPVNPIPNHLLYYISRKQILFLKYNICALRSSLRIHGAQEKVKHVSAISHNTWPQARHSVTLHKPAGVKGGVGPLNIASCFLPLAELKQRQIKRQRFTQEFETVCPENLVSLHKDAFFFFFEVRKAWLKTPTVQLGPEFPKKNDNDTPTLLTTSDQLWFIVPPYLWVLYLLCSQQKKHSPRSHAPGLLSPKRQTLSLFSFKLAKSNKAPEIFGFISSRNSCQPCAGPVRASSPALGVGGFSYPLLCIFPAPRLPPLPPTAPGDTSNSCRQAGEGSSSFWSPGKSFR